MTGPEGAATGDEGWLRAALAVAYGAPGARLRALPGGPDKRQYRVDRPGRAPWLLRVAPPAARPGRWRADAAVLDFLEHRAYPALRAVRTAAGEPVLAHERGLLFATTFITGAALDGAPANLAPLGRAVGRLHALPLPPPDAAALPPAGMLPAAELAYARSQLAAVRGQVPPDLDARYELLEHACARDDWGVHLPSVLLHNDCHPGNAVRTADGAVVLIDWEGAGLGPAIVDLGFLLVSVALPLPPGWDRDPAPHDWTPPPPALRRMEAALAGYLAERMPSPAELAGLADAMRFRTLVAAACSFAAQVARGLDRDPAPWWWWRYEAAEALAVAPRVEARSSLPAPRPREDGGC